jgi:translation initiation factor IF-2
MPVNLLKPKISIFSLFSVIYDAVDEVRDALEGLLSPEIKEEMLGIAEVRETFKVSKIGTIAGCYVTMEKSTEMSQSVLYETVL